jgi:hypothetical protein
MATVGTAHWFTDCRDRDDVPCRLALAPGMLVIVAISILAGEALQFDPRINCVLFSLDSHIEAKCPLGPMGRSDHLSLGRNIANYQKLTQHYLSACRILQNDIVGAGQERDWPIK